MRGCKPFGMSLQQVSLGLARLPFLSSMLKQTTKTVVEITTKFKERALLVTQYFGDGEMKMKRYHDILRTEIRDFVSMDTCTKFD